MKKFILFVLLLAAPFSAVAFLTGCLSGGQSGSNRYHLPAYTNAVAHWPELQPASGRVVVFFPTGPKLPKAGATFLEVSVDGKHEAFLMGETFALMDLAPGKHRVSSGFAASSAATAPFTEIDLTAHETTYIKLALDPAQPSPIDAPAVTAEQDALPILASFFQVPLDQR